MLSKIIFVQNWQKLNEQFVNNYVFSKKKTEKKFVKENGQNINYYLRKKGFCMGFL